MAKIIDCGECFYYSIDNSYCNKKRKFIIIKIIKCRFFRLKDVSDGGYLLSEEENDIYEKIIERKIKKKTASLFEKIIYMALHTFLPQKYVMSQKR